MDDNDSFFGRGTFEIDGTEFVRGFGHSPGGNRVLIQKQAPLIEQYVELCRARQPQTIIELGIFDGGGTALLALLARHRSSSRWRSTPVR